MTDSRESQTTGPVAGDSEPELPVVPFEGDGAEWDGLLTQLSGANFCHLYGWKAVMEDALGHQTYWWVAKGRTGEVEGVLPMVRVRSLLFGDYLVSMPFLNYGGPVGSPRAKMALAARAQATAQDLGVGLLELRARAELDGHALTRNQRKVTVLKSLPDSTEVLWDDGLRSKVRSQVRRPMKEGLEVSFGPELLDPFYGIFSATMRDLGTPVLPKSFFLSIREHLADASLFAVVERNGEPLAAGCGLYWGDELEITWAGASREHSRLAPNMLLYWGMMEEAVRRGMDTFNFGRCTPGSGTHRFKRQWGTDDQPLPWLQWSPSGVQSTPNPDSPKYRLATNLWGRLPLSVANRLGPPLSRRIP